MVPVPLLLYTMGNGTNFWYRYHLVVLPRKWQISPFSSIFSSINLLQFIPYQKSTMESTQNNSKSGLSPIKPLFLKLGSFPKIKIIKDEVRVLFPYLESLPIFSSKLLDHKGARKWEETQPKLDLSLALALFSLFSSFLLQKRDCSK